MEEWKDIKGYEGIYQISNKGRVKSLNRIDSRGRKRNEKILSPTPINGGYLHLNLYKNGKKKPYLIHRLVAEAFLPNPDNLPVVNHKDENKLNNNVENLEWCSVEYNNKYGTRQERITKKLKGKKKAHKKILCVETGEIFIGSQDVIDKMIHNGTSSVIRNNLRGRTKKAYGYTFKYIDE